MAKKSEENINPASVDEESSSGKGHATPSRKEREAANKRPLVPSDRKEAARMERARANEERNKARIGLAAGEEKYLPLRDRGPQKKFARDFVDARYNVGELMVPFMFLVIIMTFIPSLPVQESSFLVLWAFFFIALTDVMILGVQLRKRITAKFGSVDKGVRWYAGMRSLQMRPLRLPKPQVGRRQYPS
ncbi:DUF3043 domain-containing protein [Aurantimicrobium minutum]|uniref:DUF3043 domain-containing protein n=1 Tax=Aurantimicrobium minutum TaxID=708131 RepID=UPI002476F1BD|nr:DUF3043 domain-containing protein [Aurantimicrobium minutum]MDH6422636.1 hypothetical protein [Aurantimicrobium minutum]